MNPAEMEKTLKTINLLVDTREQPTKRYKNRMKAVGFPYRREKLDFGDYSAEYTIGSNVVSLKNSIVIERKMSLDEICGNFTKGRTRFEHEFERAIQNGAKVHLIIENGSYEKVIAGDYRSKLNANSLYSSLIAFCDRYNITIHFCDEDTTPSLIHKLIYHHVRNELQKEGNNID